MQEAQDLSWDGYETQSLTNCAMEDRDEAANVTPAVAARRQEHLRLGFMGHQFRNVQISDQAVAILGNVHISCADLMPQLSPDHTRRVLANALRYQGISSRMNQIRTADPETCSWVWRTTFPQWLNNGKDDIFWIAGKPGSGKSTLMKYLVRNPEILSHLPSLGRWRRWSIVHFFFDFRASSQLANSEMGLFRSILYQLVKACSFELAVLQEYGIDLADMLESPNHEQVMLSLTALLSGNRIKVLLFIDGLDECGSNVRWMIQSVRSIQERLQMKVCLASRPEALLKLLLEDCISLRVEDSNGTGVAAYVHNTFAEIDHTFNPQVIPLRRVEDYIIGRANGVFLWVCFSVELAIDRIVSGALEDEIYEELDTLSQEMGQMYDRIFQRIPKAYREEASIIMILLETAQHPVPIGLLLGACAFILHSISRPVLSTMTINNFRIRLAGFLGGLVDLKPMGNMRQFTATEAQLLENMEVRLLHETLKTYIHDSRALVGWQKQTLQDAYRDQIWSRVFCGTIVSSQKLLGNTSWTILDEFYGLPQKCWSSSTSLESIWQQVEDSNDIKRYFTSRVRTALTISQNNDKAFVPPGCASKLLATSIWSLGISGMKLDLHRGDLLMTVTAALQCSLMLFFDILNAKRLYFWPHGTSQSYLSELCDDRSTGLFIAAALHWKQYIQLHQDDIYHLSKLQRRFMLGCLLRERVYTQRAAWSTPLESAEASTEWEAVISSRHAIIELMTLDGKVDIVHFLIYLCRMADEEVPKFLRTAIDQDDNTLASLELIVKPSMLDWFSLELRRDIHVVEIWAKLVGRSHRALIERMHFMVSYMKVDIEAWRDSTGMNLAHVVIDTCLTLGDFHGVFLKLDILLELGVDFWQKTAKGLTVIERAREMLKKVVRLNEIHAKGAVAEADDFGTAVDDKRKQVDHSLLRNFDVILSRLDGRSTVVSAISPRILTQNSSPSWSPASSVSEIARDLYPEDSRVNDDLAAKLARLVRDLKGRK